MSHIGDREPGETDSANDGISNRDLDRSLQSLDDARQVILLAMSRAEPGGEESLFSASQITISPQSPGDVPLVAAYSELTSFRRQQDRALGGSEESSHCSRSTVWVSTTTQTHTLSLSLPLIPPASLPCATYKIQPPASNPPVLRSCFQRDLGMVPFYEMS